MFLVIIYLNNGYGIINFDDLLGFWLIPICIPNILFVPKPSIEPDNDK